MTTALRPAAGSSRDGVVDVGLEPRHRGRPAARLVHELPRHVAGARLAHDDLGDRAVLGRVRAALAEPALGRARLRGIGRRDRVRGEQHLDLGGAVEAVDGCLELGDPVAHALDERLHEAGVVEELAHLVDLDHVAEPGVGERVGEVLAVLAAARVRAVGARRDRDELRVTGGLRLGERVVEVRVPVAVAPQHRQVDAAAGELGLEGGLQLAVLLVDRADAAEVAVVVCDLFEALVGDAATARDVAQERDHVVLTLGAAEPGEQDRVVRDRLGDVLGSVLRRGRRTRDDGADGARCGCRGPGLAAAVRRG